MPEGPLGSPPGASETQPWFVGEAPGRDKAKPQVTWFRKGFGPSESAATQGDSSCESSTLAAAGASRGFPGVPRTCPHPPQPSAGIALPELALPGQEGVSLRQGTRTCCNRGAPKHRKKKACFS